MWDWMLAPVDPSRVHDVGVLLSWHARAMVLAWAVLVPVGVLAARYFKVLPGQNWPHQVDSRAWWITHRGAQYSALCLMIFGLAMILIMPRPAPSATPSAWIHHLLGWAGLALAGHQLLSGLLRGTKGGPTDPHGSLRGDHYDMTRRRLVFEYFHKSIGYLGLSIAVFAILTGLWQANAPHILWIVIIAWWGALVLFIVLFASKLRRVTTYQAIWGPDQDHPGNQCQ